MLPKFDPSMPIPVRRALRELGEDIKNARRRRRIPAPLMAERAQISRGTLTKIEQGAPGVALGNYARALFVLGMTDRLQNLAAPGNSPLEQELNDRNLPQRVRLPRPRKEMPND